MKPTLNPLTAARKVRREDWVWLAYLLGTAGVFGVLEARALNRGHDTLSAFIWRLSSGWPPFGWALGLATGFLGAHFEWTNQGLSETDERESRD